MVKLRSSFLLVTTTWVTDRHVIVLIIIGLLAKGACGTNSIGPAVFEKCITKCRQTIDQDQLGNNFPGENDLPVGWTGRLVNKVTIEGQCCKRNSSTSLV